MKPYHRRRNARKEQNRKPQQPYTNSSAPSGSLGSNTLTHDYPSVNGWGLIQYGKGNKVVSEGPGMMIKDFTCHKCHGPIDPEHVCYWCKKDNSRIIRWIVSLDGEYEDVTASKDGKERGKQMGLDESSLHSASERDQKKKIRSLAEDYDHVGRDRTAMSIQFEKVEGARPNVNLPTMTMAS